jgi:hemolysin III
MGADVMGADSSANNLKEPYQVTEGEEIAHALTHGLGALLSLAGFAAMFAVMPPAPSSAQILACLLYGGSMVLLYAASTIFHAVPARMVRAKRLFQRVDHGAIYVLIAGTYTPFTLLALEDPWGSRLFVIIWALASLGLLITLRSLWGHDTRHAMRRYERRSLALYLTMGWLGVLALKPITDALPGQSFWLLLGGGVAYTAGVLFFVAEKKWMHSVWHLFVLAGSAMHFASVFLLL